jgi:hypothetical protein
VNKITRHQQVELQIKSTAKFNSHTYYKQYIKKVKQINQNIQKSSHVHQNHF